MTDQVEDNAVRGIKRRYRDMGDDSYAEVVSARTTALSVEPVDRSGSITAGAVAQTLMAANSARGGWSLQNNSSGDLWFNELGSAAVATQPSIKVAAGDYYESPVTGCPTGAISVYGATTGQTFSAREW